MKGRLSGDFHLCQGVLQSLRRRLPYL